MERFPLTGLSTQGSEEACKLMGFEIGRRENLFINLRYLHILVTWIRMVYSAQ